jgi:hypothetical protein
MDQLFKSISKHIDDFVDRNPGILSIAAATSAQTLVDLTGGVYGILTGHGSEVADQFDKRSIKATLRFDHWAMVLSRHTPVIRLPL